MRFNRNDSAITWEAADGRLNVIDFDADMGEDHAVSVTITEHPVESGSNVIDHVRPNADTLSLSIFISNTPSNRNGAKVDGTLYPKFGAEILDVVDGKWNIEFDRVATVYDELRRLARTGTIVTVHTSIRSYESMLISDVGAPRTPDSGEAVTFNVGFREFSVVTSDVAQIPAPVNTRDKTKRGRGPKATKDTDPKTKEDGSVWANFTGHGKAV